MTGLLIGYARCSTDGPPADRGVCSRANACRCILDAPGAHDDVTVVQRDKRQLGPDQWKHEGSVPDEL